MNSHINGAFFKAIGYLEDNKKYSVSVSGGSDSDVVIDFIAQCGFAHKVDYVFFDTGLEYAATKKHLDYLENKYDIKIERVKAFKPIVSCCSQYGVPFISKFVSQCIDRLQKHGFTWEDAPYSELIKEYPDCQSALRWWTNTNDKGLWNISYKKYLKEFMLDNPPDFRISAKCCTYAKKKTAERYYKERKPDITVLGLRAAEGGIRSVAITSCYSTGKQNQPDQYRPIWWFTDQDKKEYCQEYGVIHSDCYTKYGFKRTGCACCPFSMDLNYELAKTERYENKLYKAVSKVFGKSYEYTAQYYQYRREKEKEDYRQKVKTPSLELWTVGA